MRLRQTPFHLLATSTPALGVGNSENVQPVYYGYYSFLKVNFKRTTEMIKDA